MNLGDLLEAGCVVCPLRGGSKQAVIEELVDVLVGRGLATDKADALAAVWAREKVRSTAIGLGLAIPHAKTAAVGKLTVAMGKVEGGIDFSAPDAQPVNLVILLLSPPDQTGPHIKALARISRLVCMDGFRQAIAAATTPQQILDALRHQEAQLR